MGPPPAIAVLHEALEYGADRGILLSDRRLAASDTLATAYAIYRVIDHIGDVDIVFTGLQTTDGDTAQTGPQIAERMNLSQITYCETMEIKDGKVTADRIIDGGMQKLETNVPVLITIANSATKLENKKFANVFKLKELQRDEEKLAEKVVTVTLDDVEADATRVGLVGSPTVVGKTWKIGEKGGSCVVFSGDSPTHEVDLLMDSLVKDERGIEEYVL